MKKILGVSVLVALALSGCGHTATSTAKKSAESATQAVVYSDEEYAMAAFSQAKGKQGITSAQLRVLTRSDGLFIGDQDSDTQGTVFTSRQQQVQATDAAGKTTTYAKATLRKQLKVHRAAYDEALQRGKRQEKAAQSAASATTQASAQASATEASSTSASRASASSTASVDMKNLSTAQVQDWVIRNLEKYTPDTYTYDDPNMFGWNYSHDDQGQLVVHVSENHDYANAHGADLDPNVAPTVAEFTITSDGELAVADMGNAGMAMFQALNGNSDTGEPVVVATNFND